MRPKVVKVEAAPVVVAMEKMKQEEQKEQITQVHFFVVVLCTPLLLLLVIADSWYMVCCANRCIFCNWFLNRKQIQKQNEDDILRKVVELEEEKRKLQSKLKQVERKNDHFQRALRLAEIPKLNADWEKRKTADQEYLKEQYVCFVLVFVLLLISFRFVEKSNESKVFYMHMLIY